VSDTTKASQRTDARQQIISYKTGATANHVIIFFEPTFDNLLNIVATLSSSFLSSVIG
jgi:hypothetical protein